MLFGFFVFLVLSLESREMDVGAEVLKTEKPEPHELSLFAKKSSLEAILNSASPFSAFSVVFLILTSFRRCCL